MRLTGELVAGELKAVKTRFLRAGLHLDYAVVAVDELGTGVGMRQNHVGVADTNVACKKFDSRYDCYDHDTSS